MCFLHIWLVVVQQIHPDDAFGQQMIRNLEVCFTSFYFLPNIFLLNNSVLTFKMQQSIQLSPYRSSPYYFQFSIH